MLTLLAACNRERPATNANPAPAAATSVARPAAATGLQDVIERDPRYMIGISYPPIANRYPALAAELKRYADAARADLLQAVAALGQSKPTAPYDLSLSFTEVVSTPRLIAIAADGSSYTGGAHGAPLVARFVWLPPADRASVVKNAGRMIDEGTGPDVANFSQFEPVLEPDGRIAALRFVFPPYQVGPYADGTQTVDVPADVLLPRIAPAYRSLFIGG